MAKGKKQSKRPSPQDPLVSMRDEMTTVAVDRDQLNTFLRLLRVAGQMQQACDTYLRAFGLSTGRLALLLVLIETPQEPQSPSYLAMRLAVTRATITGLTNSLEKLGLVHRRPDPHDGRKAVVGISLKARQLIQQVLPGYYDCIARMMQKVEKKRLTRLDKTLSLIEGNTISNS